MLARVRVPVLFTHHFRTVDAETGRLVGASSDDQARRAREIVTAAGGRIDYRSFPDMPHSMHEHDPKRYVETVLDWASTLDRPDRSRGVAMPRTAATRRSSRRSCTTRRS